MRRMVKGLATFELAMSRACNHRRAGFVHSFSLSRSGHAVRWPSSALFIELYFRFSTRFSIFIELYFRFSILFSIFIHLYSRFYFRPLVFSIFIHLYSRFDFRPLVFSIFIHLYSRFDFRSIPLGSLSRRGPKVGGSVVPSERAHGIARVYVYT